MSLERLEAQKPEPKEVSLHSLPVGTILTLEAIVYGCKIDESGEEELPNDVLLYRVNGNRRDKVYIKLSSMFKHHTVDDDFVKRIVATKEEVTFAPSIKIVSKEFRKVLGNVTYTLNSFKPWAISKIGRMAEELNGDLSMAVAKHLQECHQMRHPNGLKETDVWKKTNVTFSSVTLCKTRS